MSWADGEEFWQSRHFGDDNGHHTRREPASDDYCATCACGCHSYRTDEASAKRWASEHIRTCAQEIVIRPL